MGADALSKSATGCRDPGLCSVRLGTWEGVGWKNKGKRRDWGHRGREAGAQDQTRGWWLRWGGWEQVEWDRIGIPGRIEGCGCLWFMGGQEEPSPRFPGGLPPSQS